MTVWGTLWLGLEQVYGNIFLNFLSGLLTHSPKVNLLQDSSSVPDKGQALREMILPYGLKENPKQIPFGREVQAQGSGRPGV